MVETKADRLSTLIQRFRISARVHPSDSNAGVDRRPTDAPPNLLVVRRGHQNGPIDHQAGADFSGPTLLFFPTGAPSDSGWGKIACEDVLVCATVHTGGEANPLALALPEVVAIPLYDASPLKAVTDLLLDEAKERRCGGRAVIDRLCEVVVIRLLRHLIERGRAETGLVAGLAHPNLSQAIVAMHDSPEASWRLEELAEVAAMSRTHFANTFRNVVGVTPGEYLSNWRLTLARMEIAKGASLKAVARNVGFSSSAALSRALTRHYGGPVKQSAMPV